MLSGASARRACFSGSITSAGRWLSNAWFCGSHRSMLVFVHRADKACHVLSTMVAFLVKFICIVLCSGIRVYACEAGRSMLRVFLCYLPVSFSGRCFSMHSGVTNLLDWLASKPWVLLSLPLQSWCCEDSGLEHFIDTCLPGPHVCF